MIAIYVPEKTHDITDKLPNFVLQTMNRANNKNFRTTLMSFDVMKKKMITVLTVVLQVICYRLIAFCNGKVYFVIETSQFVTLQLQKDRQSFQY